MWNTCLVQALTSSPLDHQIKMTTAKTSQPAEMNQNYTYSFFLSNCQKTWFLVSRRILALSLCHAMKRLKSLVYHNAMDRPLASKSQSLLSRGLTLPCS